MIKDLWLIFVVHLQFLLLFWDSNQADKNPQSLVDFILNQLLYLRGEVAVEVVDEEDVALVQRQLAFPHKGGIVQVNCDDGRPFFRLKRYMKGQLGGGST